MLPLLDGLIRGGETANLQRTFVGQLGYAGYNVCEGSKEVIKPHTELSSVCLSALTARNHPVFRGVRGHGAVGAICTLEGQIDGGSVR